MVNQELVSCLEATLNPDATIRHHAEYMLQQGSKQEGFAMGLLSISQAAQLPLGIRQLAAVLLRQHIKHHWSQDTVQEGKPCVTEAEKNQIRAMLPAGLADPNSRMQMAVGMAIAEITKWDDQSQWPQLLPGLVQAIHTKTNSHLVSGAVKCLGMMVEDLPEGELLDLAATVLPELVQLVGAEGCPPGLQRQALRVFNCTVQSLEYMHRTHPGAKELLTSSLPGWLSAINAVISAPTTAQLASFWGVKFEALGCLIHLIPPFANLTGEHLHPCMTSTWGMVVSVLPLYCQVVVCGEDEDVEFGDAADGPDGAVPLPDLVSQLFELVITMAGHRRLGKFIRPSYQELAYLTLGYAQMAEEDVMRWAADVNAYLGEEDDLWGPRSSVEILLDEILDAGEKVGAHALAEAVRRRAEEAAAAKASGKEEWWKLREAVLFGLGAAADRIVEQKMAGKALPSQLDPDIIIPSLFAEDLAAGAPPFVAGRALWLLSKLSQVVPHSCRPAALAAVAAAFAPGTPAAVQAGACQAMSKLCKRAAPGDVAVVSETAFAGLCTLLPNAAEDALHLVLETLTALVAADPGAAARWEPHLTPSALKAWVDNVNDPLVGVDATDLLQALANVPGCLPPLQSRALPTLIDAIRNPGHHSGILVSGCLDMLIMLLAPSQPEAAQAVCAAAIPPTLSLLSSSDDEEVLASATALLRTALQVGKEAAMGWWGQDPAAAMATLLQAVDRLLQPTLPDRACRHVGGVILEMLRYAASLLAPHLPGLLTSVVRRLGTADDPQTMQSLLVVVAHLARLDTAQLVELLASATGPNGTSTLQAAMEKWTERQIEVRTPYDIRLTTTALGQILLCPHPALDAVVVKGKRLDTGRAIRTRARAATHAEQWSHVPLRVKLVVLLADAYIEAITQANGQSEEEEEWIEEDGSGDEDSGSDFGGGSNGTSSKWGFSDFGELIGGEDDLGLSNLDPLEAARRKTDPLSAVDVGAYVAEVFTQMAQAAPQLMQQAAAELTPTQVQAVQKIWHS